MPASDSESIAISVVVPVYNAGATVHRTVTALAAQLVDDHYEVIFVDGGSTDGTLDVLAGAGDAITLLHNPLREPASGRNLGAASGRGRVLAFTDADCEPTPGWLRAGLSALADADIVQGKVLPAAHHGPFDRTLGVVREGGLYETANLFVRREMFERTGGFEPIRELRLPDGAHFGEDAWFVWRAKRLGARTAFSDDALVHHAVRARGLRGYLSELPRRRYFPVLVSLIPELRHTFLRHRVFLSPTSLRFDVALLGIAVALTTRRPFALLATMPYAKTMSAQLSVHPRRQRTKLLAGFVAGDAISFGALMVGSIRTRCLVI